jgi:hypothetical protein
MANYDSFQDLRNRVTDGLADTTGKFFSQSEIDAAINDGVYQIFMLVHSHNIGFFFSATPILVNLLPNVNVYDLGTQFAAIDDVIPANTVDNDKEFLFRSRHSRLFRQYLRSVGGNFNFGQATEYFYDIVGDKSVMVAPAPAIGFAANFFIIGEPADNTDPAQAVPLKRMFRPTVVEYAIRKLKSKEETGEYQSHSQLLTFLMSNLSRFIKPRSLENLDTVDEYDPEG